MLNMVARQDNTMDPIMKNMTRSIGKTRNATIATSKGIHPPIVPTRRRMMTRSHTLADDHRLAKQSHRLAKPVASSRLRRN